LLHRRQKSAHQLHQLQPYSFIGLAQSIAALRTEFQASALLQKLDTSLLHSTAAMANAYQSFEELLAQEAHDW
jgi:hypothetical protein